MKNVRLTCLWISLTAVSMFFYSPPVLSQEPVKGDVTSNEQSSPGGITRALIIGISRYQFIPKLDYADKDAEYFADYLVHNHLWSINKSNIVLLTNENAKRGNVISELQRLFLLSQPGDRLIFYFSGHGDNENMTLFNKCYLLTQDTYTNNYMAGALPVNDLKDLFVTLTNRNVQVVVITDACRSGNLSGGVKGMEYTGVALTTMWHNEIKILSSQPKQKSLEGPQWGNGRGVFSYYLVEGLSGAADADRDSLITLAELRQYFGQTVVKETGKKQQPFIQGPDEYSTVIASIKSIPEKNNTKPAGNSFISPRRFQLPKDSCSLYYQQMATAIREKKFDRNESGSAADNYKRLRSCTNDKDMLLSANSQLLSALMNTAQEIVNNSFIGKNFVKEKDYPYAIDLYNQVLDMNDLKLPYEEQLTNLKRYLTVMGATLWNWKSDVNELSLILDSALKQEPEAAYLLSAKGALELRKMNYTNAIQILEKATQMGPGWLIPKYYLGIAYGYKKDYRKALSYYQEVMQKDSLYRTFDCARCIMEKMSEYEKRLNQIRYDKYKDDVEGRAALDSARNYLNDNIDSAHFYFTLAQRFDKKNHPYQDSVYFFYTQAVLLDPSEAEYMYGLIRYLRKKSYGESEIREWLRKTDEYADDDKLWFREDLIYSYLYAKETENAFKEAAKMFEEGLYGCTKMKKWANKFGKLPAYQAFIKENCQD
ncbi:MAG: caspase family protein [Sphingobacteriales bacterium]|nr:caspase family protein [Sphingobacteriales bacterium]